ncbi:phage tail protein [Enterococcus faecium]|uniref:phage tail protein n=2 Tax=Enterococcus faecium TaxID=1352 RepID=UPI00298C113F|nr:phage tail protein [Enterococcus faecium]
MIHFIDEKGNQYSAIVECKKTKGVNGEKSLSGTIYTNDHLLHGISRGWRIVFEDETYCLTYLNPIDEGTRIVVEFDAVHEFFFDMQKSVVHRLLNGSNTAERYLQHIFKDSGYEYRLEVNIPAFEKENFGLKNRLALFKDFVSSTGVEFSVNGRVVRILDKVGTNLSTIVKKGFNLNELHIEKDIGSFITYMKGYGAFKDPETPSRGRLEVEYLSPLSKIYGKLEGDPIIDERYTQSVSLLDRIKKEVESSYGISVDIDMEDLTKAGYDYDQPHEGDYIMAINQDLGFEEKVRILSYTTSYDTEGRIIDHDISCGRLNLIDQTRISDASWKSQIENSIEQATRAANFALISADGKAMTYYGPNIPTGNKFHKGDIWYKEIGEEKVLYIWNGTEWWPLVDKDVLEETKRLAEQAKLAGEDAKRTGEEIRRKSLEMGQDFQRYETDLIELKKENILREQEIESNRIENQRISQEVQSSLNSFAESFNLAFQDLDLRNTKAQQLVDQAQLNIEALKTTTGQLDQKYTSLMKSKMGLEEQISLVKHSSDEMIAQFGTYKQTVAGQLETISVLQQDASTIKQSISQLKIDSSGTKAQISQLEQTQNQVKQTILDQITGYHSEQQQLADRIALMVEKGDVIARLNIEAGKTLIQNNKIFLDADTVYFSGKAFIPMAKIKDLLVGSAEIRDLAITTGKIANASIDTAKIKDLAVTNAKLGNISADKITFGELNGAKARITNIDAANISSGFLDNQRIRSNSITADKLAVNAIQVGFNNYSQNLKIDPYNLSFFNKNQLSGKLTSEGMEFWHGTRKIGRIGENSKIGNETIRGIAMNLEHEGDYISWSYRKAQNDSAFTSMLILDPRGKFSGKAGIHMDADVHMIKVKPGIPSAREFLRFGVVNYNNTFYSALLNDSGKSGVMFGSGYLYLLHNNVVLPVEDIRNIVRALKGLGTLQLPTSIRTSGQGSGTVASYKTVRL